MINGLIKVSEVQERLKRQRDNNVPAIAGMAGFGGLGGGLIGSTIKKYKHYSPEDVKRALLNVGPSAFHHKARSSTMNQYIENLLTYGAKVQKGNNLGRGALIGGGVGASAGLLAALLAHRRKNREAENV